MAYDESSPLILQFQPVLKGSIALKLLEFNSCRTNAPKVRDNAWLWFGVFNVMVDSVR